MDSNKAQLSLRRPALEQEAMAALPDGPVTTRLVASNSTCLGIRGAAYSVRCHLIIPHRGQQGQ